MPLRLADRWVWDFWLARAGGRHHAFFLQAPRSLGRPELRHHAASIGHAVSDDLRAWEPLPDALGPGPPGAWDDLATWTGSVLERGGRWHMLYTGIGRADGGLVQRVGLAVSDDLVRWEKHPANPVLEADPRWYELLDRARWRDQSWRDPWLFEADGTVHALLTARSPHGAPDGAGVVGHARSDDLVRWEVLPPLTGPGEFAQVEAPQLVRVGDAYRILFSCLAEDHSAARLLRLGGAGAAGTFAFSAPALWGPYVPQASPVAAGLYAGRAVELAPDEWAFLAFRGAPDEAFLGELTDPLPLHVDAGELRAVDVPVPTTVGA
jgi:beta-fructofuranosidase